MNNLEVYKQFRTIKLASVPERVQEKLSVLEKSIDKESIPELKELGENEVKQLKNLAQDTQIEMYIQIKKAFIQQLIGQVDIRGDSGLKWNERQIELDLLNKVLLISRQNKDQDKHSYKLQDYFIRWVGLKSNRYCFEIYNDDKAILIGSSETNAQKWFNNIETYCKRIKQQKRTSVIEQINQQQVDYELPLMFQRIISKYTTEYFFDDTEYHLHTFDNKLKMLQKGDNLLKTYLIIENHEIQDIVQGMISQQLTWNQYLNQEDIICDIDQTALIEQQVIDLIKLIIQLSYVQLRLMRYLHLGKQIYIVDKSVEDRSYYPLKCRIIESVWTFYQQKEQVLCVNVTNYEPTLLRFCIMNYLSGFSKLQGHLDKRLTRSQLPSFYLLISDYDQVQNRYTQREDRRVEKEMEKHEQQEQQESEKVDQKGEVGELRQMSNESKEQYLRRLLREITANPQKAWKTQIHAYNVAPVEPPKNAIKDICIREQIYNTVYSIHPDGGVYLIDKEKMEHQKSVTSYMIKKMSSNLMEGKSVLSLSLPVSIFDKRSNLERYCQMHLLFPYFLENLDEKSPIEAVKNILSYAISCSFQLVAMDKPFNPILGETFQGWINGCPIYSEQISHHPPITAVQLYGRTFKLHHHFETQVELKLPNGALGREYGYIVLETKNNKYILNITSATLFGLVYGDKNLVFNYPFWVIDQKNKLLGMGVPDWERSMIFNSNKNPIDTMIGGVYEIDEAEISRFKKVGYYNYKGIKEGQYKKIAKLEGRWTTKMSIDGQEYLNWDKIHGYKLEYEAEPLASDSRYREDVIAWILDDFDLAMERKEKLENIQRADRKWRAQLGPKGKKH